MENKGCPIMPLSFLGKKEPVLIALFLVHPGSCGGGGSLPLAPTRSYRLIPKFRWCFSILTFLGFSAVCDAVNSKTALDYSSAHSSCFISNSFSLCCLFFFGIVAFPGLYLWPSVPILSLFISFRFIYLF